MNLWVKRWQNRPGYRFGNICKRNKAEWCWCIAPLFDKNKRTAIEKILKYIDTKYLILGRNNTDKDLFNVQDKPFLTIHKSKGLEEDNIILINLTNNNNSLPSKIKNHKIINKLIKTDYYPYEEERRLFYVALTRTRNNIYLLVPKSNYSIFIKELMKNYKNYIEYLNIH